MVPEMEVRLQPMSHKPRVTEIKVRMDCNGCVHKIKKALHGVTGIYDLYIDFPQQKITIIGWADPEKIVKAIRKTRKSAIICLHTEQSDEPVQETEPEAEGEAPEGGAPPPESTNPPTEQPAPPEEPSPPDNPPPPEEKPSPESANERETSQSTQHSKPKEPEEIHVIHHHPPNYGYQYAYGHYNQGGNSERSAYPSGQGFRGEPPQPVYVDHSYNTYKPSPYGHYNQGGNSERSAAYPSGPGFRGEPPQPVYVNHSYNTYKPSPYVTEYAYPQSPPRYSHYSRPDQYSPAYYSGNSSSGSVNGNGNGNITSMFSEENPNACSIV
ncbi:hypothetical protein ACS0TY_023030 [Phlomoides rotata]